MMSKKYKPGTLKAISPVIEQAIDAFGNGIVGFTIMFNDGTFTNFILPFAGENKAQALAKINHLWQSYHSDLHTQDFRQLSIKNNTMKRKTKRRLS